MPSAIRSEDATGLRPLENETPLTDLRFHSSRRGLHVLIKRSAIEAFLTALEGSPPDWATIYGHGHHDPGHDERLFNLNRERDAAREGNRVLNRHVAFVWPGELSRFDSETSS